MTVCHADFETRSVCDLKKQGAYAYVLHPTTSPWCMAYAFDDEPVALWKAGEPCPPRVAAHIEAGGEISAWNANFERLVWKAIMGPRFGWPVPRLEQFRCVMVQAFAMALPGSLDAAGAALGLDVQKDAAGYRLMLQMAKPRRMDGSTPVWWDGEDRLRRLYAYCMNDVATEREADKRLMKLRSAELAMYHLDQRINDRGVFVDQKLCIAAKKVIRLTTEKLDAEMKRVTGGTVERCSNVQVLLAWLKARGVPTDSVAKDRLADLLIRDDLPDDVRRALELRQEAAKASTAKVDAMLWRTNGDGRMRGNLQYHGAATGRWAARGAQLQNLPRPVVVK